MKKKLLSVLLVLSMVLSFYVPAIAATEETVFPLGASNRIVTIDGKDYLVNDLYNPANQSHAGARTAIPSYAWDPAFENYTFNPDAFEGLQFDPVYGFPVRATYRTTTDYLGEMNYLAQTYPDIVKLTKVGYSNGVRSGITSSGSSIVKDANYAVPIYVLEICDAPGVMDGRPATLHQCGNHGGELDSNELGMNLAWYLVTNYGKDAKVTELLNTTRVYILPYTNPDGNILSYRSASGNNRKNANSVDPNRNWAYNWGSDNGSASSISSSTYRGTSPNSEPEIKAISDVYRADHVLSSISGHTSGQLIIYAWAQMRNEDDAHPLLKQLAREQADLNVHQNQNGNVMYAQSGEINDYLWGAMRALGFTYEYGNTQVSAYLGLSGGNTYAVASFDAPKGGPRKIKVNYGSGLTPKEDIAAPVAFLSDPFIVGYGDNSRFMTVKLLEDALAKDPDFVKGKILMTYQGSSDSVTNSVIKLAQANGAVGYIVLTQASNGGYSEYTPGSSVISGVTIPVGSMIKSYAREVYEKITSGSAPNLLTLKSDLADFQSVYYQWERNFDAFMLNMSYAAKYANHIKGNITDGKGNLLPDADLDLSIDIEGKIKNTNDTLASADKQWKETQKTHYDVVGGEYDWSVLPSKQTEYEDKGYDIVATANGRYSDSKNVKVSIPGEVDPVYQLTFDNVNFILPEAISTNFAFNKSWDLRSDIVIPFTILDYPNTTVTAIVNGVSANIAVLGDGKFTATFNPRALGIKSIEDIEVVIDFEGGKPHSALTLSGSTQGNPDALKLTTAANRIKAGDYFTLNATFAKKVNTNTAILTYNFDGDLFEYASFTPAPGVTLVGTPEYSHGQAKITVMNTDYNIVNFGDIMLRAKESAQLTNTFKTVTLKADYVVKDELDEKVIKTANASASFTTIGGGWIDVDTNDDGVIDLIDLSNMVDWFGIDSDNKQWDEKYVFFDTNNNGKIDIDDVAYVARLIK